MIVIRFVRSHLKISSSTWLLFGTLFVFVVWPLETKSNLKEKLFS